MAYTEELGAGVDTTTIQAGDLSFGQKAGAVIAGATLSGINSILNTPIELANSLGGSFKEFDTANQLDELDANWGSYYKENKHAIDTTGFIATSLFPGTMAIKGLKALRAGEAAGGFRGILNLPISNQAKYLSQAVEAAQTQGGTVFSQINKYKIGTLAWGAADQALQAATFQTAVALTMHASPLLADDGVWDTTKDIIKTAMFGGVFGGAIEGLGILKDFRVAGAKMDLAANKYTATYGTKKLGLSTGDQAYSVLDAIEAIPKEIATSDAMQTFSFRLSGGAKPFTANISEFLSGKAKTSTDRALNDFTLKVREIVSGSDAAIGAGDVATADAYTNWLMKQHASLKASGADPATIKDQLGTHLWGLKSIAPATDAPIISSDNVFYFKKALSKEEIAGFKSIDDLTSAAVSKSPIDKAARAYSDPMVFTGSPQQFAAQTSKLARIGTTGEGSYPTLKAAWEDGNHIAMMPDGALRVNEAGGLWKRAKDPALSNKQFLNVRNGAFISEAPVLTAADGVVAGKKLEVTKVDVSIAKASGAVTRLAMPESISEIPATVEVATARHAWASELADKDVPLSIHMNDISMLERATLLPVEQQAQLSFIKANGEVITDVSASSALLNAKIDGLVEAFAGSHHDIRELAAKFATNESWIEKVVASQFGSALKNVEDLKADMSVPIKNYLGRENLQLTWTRPQQFTAVDIDPSTMSRAEKLDAVMNQAAYSGGGFVTGEIAYQYRVANARMATQTAAASVLGGVKAAMLPKLDSGIAKSATTGGAGSSFFGASNAGYDDQLKLASQTIGKFADSWGKEATDNIINEFTAVSRPLMENKVIGAEAGIVTNILRNDSNKFILASNYPVAEQLLAAHIEVPALAMFRRDLLPLLNDSEKFAAKVQEMRLAGDRPFIEIQNQETHNFFAKHEELTSLRNDKNTVLVTARGVTSNKLSGTVYAPPINTNNFQHFAFIRPIEGKIFGTSEVTMVFGRDANELRTRIAQVDQKIYQVIHKDSGELYKKAMGDYDFDQTINERTIDSSLRRSGALSNLFPETRGENVVQDYLRWHQNQEMVTLRNAIESNYAQQVAELRSMADLYAEDATSVFSGLVKTAKSALANPYNDYIKTMLGVSKQSEFTPFHAINEFVDALGTRAYRIYAEATDKARKGLISYEEANAIGQKHGLGQLYNSPENYFTSNAPRDKNILKETISKANSILSFFQLPADFAQSIMNVISTPVLLSTELASIKRMVAEGSPEAGKLAELLSVEVPGLGGAKVPSLLKTLAEAHKNFWDPAIGPKLLQRYKDNQDIKSVLQYVHSAVEDLALTPNYSKFAEGVESAAKTITKFTRADAAEQYTRFVSADVMRQISQPVVDAGKMTLQEQNAYISTFVNRVQGNYITSQRPIVFQGVTGAAIGLFQTYTFNLLQQLTRHVENKDTKAIATLFGMQTSLFGLNGTPMFDAVNSHIIGNANINPQHHDAYSFTPELLGKKMGDWLMYGTASAFPLFNGKAPALYARGDVNPRSITVLPLMPQDIPAIDGSIRIVSNLLDVGKKLIQGADVGSTLLQGLEHNSLNRPLAGLAQMIQGDSTTSQGSLIAKNSDYGLIINSSRILGAKPLDEAIALNDMYRQKAYKASDNDRVEILGEAVKSYVRKNQAPPQEVLDKFLKDYTSIGGRPETFSAKMQSWMKDANTSVVEKMKGNMNTSYAKRLTEVMGGTSLDDYRNAPPVPAPTAEQLPP